MTMPVMTLPVRYRSLAPIAILAALHAVPAAAQRIDDARVAPGAAVRVALTNGESQTGQYAAQSPTHLHLNRECGEGCLRADSIAWNDVRRVDAKLTLRHSGGRALIFGLAGAAIGTVVTLGAINAAVDACNAVSLHSGLPISVVDLGRARAPFGIAVAPDGASYVFNASGQEIDLAGLLCLFDAEGPCANAVRDAQRTKTRGETRETLSVLWGFAGGEERLEAAERWYRELLGGLGATTERVTQA
jgi:hypothetical protein